ncbi:MAG TPA: hypothetical protein PKM65_20385 [Spirochaetota bacterium]|nr:hypothetical protein [Spirochaetota bacterium]
MPVIGKPFAIYYTALGRATGLVDVRMVVYKPNRVKLGVYNLSELNFGDGKGVYYHDFIDADIEGTYLFVINSATKPKWDARQAYFQNPLSGTVWTDDEKRQIRDALGVDGEKLSSTGGKVQDIVAATTAIIGDTTFLRDMEGGKWELSLPNDLKFYKSDNTTLVAHFKCYNDTGLPAIDNVTRVERFA